MRYSDLCTPTGRVVAISDIALRRVVSELSFVPRDDRLSRHRGRYRALGRNFGQVM